MVGQRGGPVVPGVQQRSGLVRRQVLDPERRGEADAGEIDAGVGVQREASRDVVVARVELGGGLPAVWSVHPRRYGACVRSRSASTSGSGQRCWWRSITDMGPPLNAD